MGAPSMDDPNHWIRDEKLKEWATPRQIEYLDAVIKNGSVRSAAKAFGVNYNAITSSLKSLRTKAARFGYAPGHFQDGVAPGYRMGKVTVQRGPAGVERVWERQHPDAAREAIWQQAIAKIDADTPRLAALPAPAHTLTALLNLFVYTDYHLGMRAWAAEGGADWNMEIAERLIIQCFEHMIASSPAARVGFIAQLGDFLHFDSLLPLTPTSGHVVDADAQYEQIVDASLRIMRRLVDMALLHHQEVVVLCAEGNHDITGSMWLRVALKALYELEPRVTVIQSAAPFYAYQHGGTMLAFHHGHLAKIDALPMLFADRYSEMWGQTKKRYAHCGHRHHELAVKELSGMRVLQHPTLAPKDSHSSRHGYGANQQTSVTTYHERFGKVTEQVVTPEMLAA